jgi:NAD(P)-dependent dehydrogenase (short-subunit alcohol dehydrogenase family)
MPDLAVTNVGVVRLATVARSLSSDPGCYADARRKFGALSQFMANSNVASLAAESIAGSGCDAHTRAARRYLCDAPLGAVIVNNASVLGWRAQHAQSHYAAAKAGVMALTRCSAIEAVDYGVRINAVSPSIARHKFLDTTTSAELLDRLSADEAFGRTAESWEVAAPSRFWPATTRVT